MKYDPDTHDRRSIRLKGYDYEQAGAYFVTICTQGRACLFGVVADGKIQLNDAGKMVEQWWFELNQKFPAVETDEFVIMPNYLHGIVVITDVPVPEGGHPAHQGAHAGAPLPIDRTGPHDGTNPGLRRRTYVCARNCAPTDNHPMV